MIWSPQRKFLFIHIPKTGGTAFALAYEDRAARDDVLVGDTPKAKARRGRAKAFPARGRVWKHMRLADLDGAISAEEMEEAFICTLVRNPWDRVVSYYHWLQDQTFDHPAVDLAKAKSFTGFLNDPATQVSLAGDAAAAYLTDAHGVERASHYIRLEHFAADAQPLFGHLGFALDLPRANASARDSDWRGYYSADDAALIARLFAADIDRFSYAFDPA